MDSDVQHADVGAYPAAVLEQLQELLAVPEVETERPEEVVTGTGEEELASEAAAFEAREVVVEEVNDTGDEFVREGEEADLRSLGGDVGGRVWIKFTVFWFSVLIKCIVDLAGIDTVHSLPDRVVHTIGRERSSC